NRETFAAMLTDLKLGETASQPMNPSMGNDEDPGDGKQGVTTEAEGGGCSVGAPAAPSWAFLGLLALPLWLRRRR
ncbi:MAG: hypothetical protein RJA70_4943, partial [Pseudomonadota bacterium]